MIRSLLSLPVVLALASSAHGQEGTDPGPGLSPVTAKAIETGSKEPWRYLLYLPKRYFATGSEPLPLLLFLHGASGRGRDLEMVKRYGPPSRVKRDADFPMVMVAPQLPAGGWDPKAVVALVDEVLATYKLDADRVYLTGVSLGGQGAWNVAAHAPDRFAALAPVCGYGDDSDAPRLVKLPVWAFHGALDNIIPIAPHRALVDAVNQAAGSAKFTVFAQGDHGNIIVPIYASSGDGRLYRWLLTHRRGEKNKPLPEGERVETLAGPGSSPEPAEPASTVAAPPPSSSAGPRPGELWDALFRFLDGDGEKPGSPSERPQLGGAVGSPAP